MKLNWSIDKAYTETNMCKSAENFVLDLKPMTWIPQELCTCAVSLGDVLKPVTWMSQQLRETIHFFKHEMG